MGSKVLICNGFLGLEFGLQKDAVIPKLIVTDRGGADPQGDPQSPFTVAALMIPHISDKPLVARGWAV